MTVEIEDTVARFLPMTTLSTQRYFRRLPEAYRRFIYAIDHAFPLEYDREGNLGMPPVTVQECLNLLTSLDI